MFDSVLKIEFFNCSEPRVSGRPIKSVMLFKLTANIKKAQFVREVDLKIGEGGLRIGTVEELRVTLANGIPAIWDAKIIAKGESGRIVVCLNEPEKPNRNSHYAAPNEIPAGTYFFAVGLDS